MTFDEALKPILLHEGGYVNDKDDPGGPTNKGITQNVYDAYRRNAEAPTRSVLYITQEEVGEIYYENYWIEAKCNALPLGLNLVHFDFAVNAGTTRAAKTLQQIAGVTQDGIIGPRTLGAVAKLDPREAIYEYSQARRGFYERLAARKPTSAKFLRGWLKRVADIERRAINSLPRPTQPATTD
jgi:lysozyme family protein